MSLIEAEAIESELSPPFTVALPEQLKVPLVFNSPHSGRIYPSTFLAASRLDSRALRRSEDAYVEELFAFVTGLGAPLLYAHFPRAYLDVNREPYELDPILFRDGLPHYAIPSRSGSSAGSAQLLALSRNPTRSIASR